MERERRITYFESLYNKLKHYDNEKIEEALIEYVKINLLQNQLTMEYVADNSLINIFYSEKFPIDIEFIIEFFEYLLDKDQKNENGIVFTPKYISDYIANDCLESIQEWSKDIKIIDPGCGCGIFLISAIEYLHKKFKIDIKTIIENNIYGIDIIDDNIKRCKFVLELYHFMNSKKNTKIKCNLICKDSLNCNWKSEFKVRKFDYVIGNPPYVNPHDMKIETVNFLKDKYITTKEGVFNIFYAFIEEGLNNLEDGDLEFIIPNNVLTIKSALKLRELLNTNDYVDKIIDFSDNMVFKPVRTYNCIIKINKKTKNKIRYAILKKASNIERKLYELKFSEIAKDRLDNNGWKLVDEKTRNNINKIENQKIQIKDFIRTGIATLKDKVYLVDKDKNGYYKMVNDIKFKIEEDIVKPIYKIPDLKKCEEPSEAVQYIIFPYIKEKDSYKLINEDELESNYPLTYKYLLTMKDILGERDKGKENPYGWYAYGRTQGLNKYGKKMVFPTFASYPKFRFIDDENALFCNGYAVFENDKISLAILEKILNSKIMQYYISNTSYPIEGGYYCYQKKYIEKFSVPEFTDSELEILMSSNKSNIDDLLVKKYDLQ